jgi:transcription elongation factor
MDQGLHKKFRSSDTVTVIKLGLLECVGHVVRIDSTRTGKKLLDVKPGGGIKKDDLK